MYFGWSPYGLWGGGLPLLCEGRRAAICTECRKENSDHILNRPFRNAEVGNFVDRNSISMLEKNLMVEIFLVQNHVTYAGKIEAVTKVDVGPQGVLLPCQRE